MHLRITQIGLSESSVYPTDEMCTYAMAQPRAIRTKITDHITKSNWALYEQVIVSDMTISRTGNGIRYYEIYNG